ncbi:hypothetical protein Vadar_020628 [Vaccinium darrowii]|uniref:Uncharacterized protein n=1 Tax=Vaccinium darrowii TaxID=229202 RepID=A0ACB7Y985_9ERIC|nr:hypothetical protein Vadar_020628 [Vaccinium darrowii]
MDCRLTVVLPSMQSTNAFYRLNLFKKTSLYRCVVDGICQLKLHRVGTEEREALLREVNEEREGELWKEKQKREKMVEFTFSLDIHVGGKIVEGLPVKYLNGVVASSKVDPNIFNFVELLATIRDCGYGVEDNITLFYKLPNSDMNTGLVPLRSQADLVNMFAVNSGSVVTKIFVDYPNEEDENDDEDPGLDLGVGDGDGDRDVEVGDEVRGEQVEEEQEESSNDEQEESIPIIGLGLNFGVDQVMDAGSDSDNNNLVEQVEDENGNPVYPKFKDSYLKNPQLIEGMKFPNVRVFRQLLREYHIKEVNTFKFIKNESSRVTVRCTDNCGFRLHASPIISDAPEIKEKSMKKTVWRESLINVSQNQVYRAKRKALELIQGNYKEQYARLRDYCEMVRIQNPGPFGGQLMHVVAKDGNNQMFPLAMAVVEAETKDSWAWFMENLEEIIGHPEEKHWCFIYDRQKGLTQVFADYYPNAEHRHCIRHMYANFNKIYKGKEWKDLM